MSFRSNFKLEIIVLEGLKPLVRIIKSHTDYCVAFQSRGTLGSRGYFFLIDVSRRSRVNEEQSAEEKK